MKVDLPGGLRGRPALIMILKNNDLHTARSQVLCVILFYLSTIWLHSIN